MWILGKKHMGSLSKDAAAEKVSLLNIFPFYYFFLLVFILGVLTLLFC